MISAEARPVDRRYRRYMQPPRCSVVVCDDQATFRGLVAMVIATEPDLEVVGEAANGREAVELAARLQPDVLLLDIAMPVMDGLEALPLIRAAAPATRVIVLSGVTAASIREHALAAGAASVVEKGADIERLTQFVKDACESVPDGDA